MCTNPNTLATHCWKTISSSVTLNACTAPSSVDCGLFCASSDIQCAKITMKIISAVVGFAAMFTGGSPSSTESQPLLDAKAILSDNPPSFWANILKAGKNIYATQSVQNIKKLLTNLSKILSLITSIDFACKFN